jgi:aminoglycoside phosphotransferase (APT) family kinase protein
MSTAIVNRTFLNSGTASIRAGQEVDLERLQAWMRSHVSEVHAPLRIEQFKGGQSNPTYKLICASGDYVLRRKPPGKLLKSAHAVDRECRVLRALGTTNVPVPRILGQCLEEDVLGTEFYLMEFKPGRIFWDLIPEDQTPAQRREIWDAANEALARLHRVDFAAVGLSDYGNPLSYFERQFKRWSEQYQYTRDAVPNPAMDHLINWLPSRIPGNQNAAIVHGDYQFSNMIFHPERSEVVAILDWELSTLGSPLADLAYFCRVYHLPVEHGGLRGVDLQAAGIPSERDFVAAYLSRTGFNIPGQWAFYVVFSMFRLAAIRQGVAQRVLDGTAASAHAKVVAASAVPMADYAWRLARSLP